MNPRQAPPSRIFIDGDCGLCNGLAGFVAARDRHGRFTFVPGNTTDSLVLDTGHRTYRRSAAVLRILAGLGFPYSWFARIALVIPGPIRDAAYNIIARNRRRLSCPLP